jgi:hypothetical protein
MLTSVVTSLFTAQSTRAVREAPAPRPEEPAADARQPM